MKTIVNILKARNYWLKELKIHSYSLKYCDSQSCDLEGEMTRKGKYTDSWILLALAFLKWRTIIFFKCKKVLRMCILQKRWPDAYRNSAWLHTLWILIRTGSVSGICTRGACLYINSIYPCVSSVQDMINVSCNELHLQSNHLAIDQIIFANPWQQIKSTPLSAFINKSLSLVCCAHLTSPHIDDRTFERINVMMWSDLLSERLATQAGIANAVLFIWLASANFADRLFATMLFGVVVNLLRVSAGSEVDAAAFQHDASSVQESDELMCH